MRTFFKHCRATAYGVHCRRRIASAPACIGCNCTRDLPPPALSLGFGAKFGFRSKFKNRKQPWRGITWKSHKAGQRLAAVIKSLRARNYVILDLRIELRASFRASSCPLPTRAGFEQHPFDCHCCRVLSTIKWAATVAAGGVVVVAVAVVVRGGGGGAALARALAPVVVLFQWVQARLNNFRIRCWCAGSMTK